MIQKGIKNEIDFVNYLNKKRLDELSDIFKMMLKSIFLNLHDSDVIECWKSNYREKADIKIRINGEIKGVSIKSGHNCSMHQESVLKFYKFLERIGVDDYIIKLFDDFMIGKVGGVRVNSKYYILTNFDKIQLIRHTFNDYYIKTNLILRFIFQGTEIQKFDCDAIIYGNIHDFLWATKSEILEYLINYKLKHFDYINISALNIKNYDRDLRNSGRANGKMDIQVKWFNLEKDFQIIHDMRICKLLNKKI